MADSEVTAIVIGTWPYTHKTMVIAALQVKHKQSALHHNWIFPGCL